MRRREKRVGSSGPALYTGHVLTGPQSVALASVVGPTSLCRHRSFFLRRVSAPSVKEAAYALGRRGGLLEFTRKGDPTVLMQRCMRSKVWISAHCVWFLPHRSSHLILVSVGPLGLSRVICGPLLLARHVTGRTCGVGGHLHHNRQIQSRNQCVKEPLRP